MQGIRSICKTELYFRTVERDSSTNKVKKQFHVQKHQKGIKLTKDLYPPKLENIIQRYFTWEADPKFHIDMWRTQERQNIRKNEELNIL